MKYVAAAVRRYRLELRGHDWFEPLTTPDLYRVIRSLHMARRGRMPLVVTLLPPEVSWAPACTWCRARPRVVEYDCDGTYLSSICGSPQCSEARRLAYEGVILYPSYRSGHRLRRVQPTRVQRADGPRPGVVTVDEYGALTCLCGNTQIGAGFRECLPGGAIVDPDHPGWDGLYWCAGDDCPGVIVDCRYLDDVEQEPESVTDAFPVELRDQCRDCSACADAPPEKHTYSCSVNWR